MLPPVIFELWLGELSLDTRLQATPPEELSAARAYWAELTSLGMDQIEAGIAAGDNKPLRSLAWFLLGSACAYVVRGEVTPATGFQRWAEAAATHAADIRVAEEGLVAHTIFFRGVLAYHRNDLDEAMTAYAHAQDIYDQMVEGRVLVGLAILGQATIEVELAERERTLTSSSTRCARGLTLLGPLADRGEAEKTPRARIDRLIAQRRWANQLLANAAGRPSLDDRPDLFDGHISLLVGRRLRDRLADGVFDGAYALARLADDIAVKLEQTAQTSDALLTTLIQSGQFAGLELFVRDALADRPGDVQLHQALSVALGQQGRYDDLRVFLDTILVTTEPSAWIHRDLASALTALGRPDDAAYHREAAERIEPTEPLASADQPATGETTTGLNEGERTLLTVAAFLRQNPAELAGRLAELAAMQPDLATQASELLEAEGALSEEALPPPIAHLRQAEALYRDRKWEESLGEFRQAIGASPNFSRAFQGIGKILFGHGAFASAAVHFREAIEIKPTAETFRLFADCYRNLGALFTAFVTYQQAVMLDPTDSLARTDRDTILAKLGITEGISLDAAAEALVAMPPRERSETETANLRQLIRQNLQSSEQLVTDGNAEGALGLDLRSLDAARSTANLEDAVAAISYHLGGQLSRLGLFHAALAAHRNVLGVNPGPDNPFGFLSHLAIGTICAQRPDLGDPVVELEAALRACSAPTKNSLDPLAWHSADGAWYRVGQPAPAQQAATVLAMVLEARGDAGRAEAIKALAGRLGEGKES